MARAFRKAAELGLEAVTIEGGLIAPEQVAAIAAAPRDAKLAASYDVPKGLTLADEISRYFRIGQGIWARLRADRRADDDADRGIRARAARQGVRVRRSDRPVRASGGHAALSPCAGGAGGTRAGRRRPAIMGGHALHRLRPRAARVRRWAGGPRSPVADRAVAGLAQRQPDLLLGSRLRGRSRAADA